MTSGAVVGASEAASPLPNQSAMIADALDRLRAAAGFLTRLPVAPAVQPAGDFLARAGVAFPVVGAGIGIVGGGVYAITTSLVLPPLASAFVALAAMIALTGALHEDGLADFCDGVGGGRDRHNRLRIMRDSHNGTFGTLALVLGVGLRAALVAGIAAPGPALAALVAAGAISRALLPAVMGLMAPARTDGIAAAAGRPSRPQIAATLAVALIIAWLAVGLAHAALALVIAAASAVAVAGLAGRALGGHTGDVLGACQQVAEIAVLGVAAVALAGAP